MYDAGGSKAKGGNVWSLIGLFGAYRLTATSCCAPTSTLAASLITSEPGAIVTEREPAKVSGLFEPGTSRATPWAIGRPIQASRTRTGVEPKGLPNRTRTLVVGTDSRAIWRTVTFGDVPCTPSRDASQTPATVCAVALGVTWPPAAAPEVVRVSAASPARTTAVMRHHPPPARACQSDSPTIAGRMG